VNRGQIEVGGKASPIHSAKFWIFEADIEIEVWVEDTPYQVLRACAGGISMYAYLRVRVYNSTKWQQER
jgi:hypothetical protein